MQQLTLAEFEAEYTRRVASIDRVILPLLDYHGYERAMAALNRWRQEIVERLPQ